MRTLTSVAPVDSGTPVRHTHLMASIVEGELMTDPQGVLAEREALALRSMYALVSIAENSKDDKARVSACTELNKMLSLGLSNRPQTFRATQVNNNLRLGTPTSDDATMKLLAKFNGGGTNAAPTDIRAVNESLDALGDLDE